MLCNGTELLRQVHRFCWGACRKARAGARGYHVCGKLPFGCCPCGSFATVSILSALCLCSPGATLTLVPCPVLVPQTGYNLVMCNYALSDREGMKTAFQKLLKVRAGAGWAAL